MTSYMKFSKVEALRGALGPTLGRGGKRKGRRACNYVESLEFELPLNRGEKSLRYVAIIAKFLDDNKTKMPLKK